MFYVVVVGPLLILAVYLFMAVAAEWFARRDRKRMKGGAVVVGKLEDRFSGTYRLVLQGRDREGRLVEAQWYVPQWIYIMASVGTRVIVEDGRITSYVWEY